MSISSNHFRIGFMLGSNSCSLRDHLIGSPIVYGNFLDFFHLIKCQKNFYWYSVLMIIINYDLWVQPYLYLSWTETVTVFLANHPRWVSSTPFGILFDLPVQFLNRGSSPFNICKWIVQKYFNIISVSFQNLFLVIVKWKRMYLLHLSLLLYWNETIVYQFKCHLSYRFRYQFGCI